MFDFTIMFVAQLRFKRHYAPRFHGGITIQDSDAFFSRQLIVASTYT